MVSERIVDALEFVDVDIEQRERLALARLLELALDLLAEQHAVRQVGQRVVMRKVRDLFVATPALGDVLDDVDDVARLAGVVANADAPRRDEPRFCSGTRPQMLFQEEAVGGMQCPVVVGRHDFCRCLRQQVERRLADHEVAGDAELGLGDAVDQQIAAIMGVLHGDLRGNMIDDLAQEGVVAVPFFLETAPFGDVFQRGDQPPCGNGLATV